MRFLNPEWLLLLFLFPLVIWYYSKFQKYTTGKLKYSYLNIIHNVNPGYKTKIAPWVKLPLRLLCLFFLILALSRPQAGHKSEEVTTKGVDIILCLDTSTSMRALDFKPLNRLDAAKKTAKEFVKMRKNDRIGIVVFSGVSYTQCPLTLDHGAVLDFIDKVEIGMTQVDGTAIGNAIATCVNRLKDSAAKSKIIVLLTDGRNNMGEIDPFTAAKLATSMGIKIYTIGCGVRGKSMYPVDDPIFGTRYVWLPEDIDEDTLVKIASLSNGEYFRATSVEGLKNIYKQIDTMEKTELKVTEYIEYTELFPYFIFPALFIFLGEILLTNTIFRKLP